MSNITNGTLAYRHNGQSSTLWHKGRTSHAGEVPAILCKPFIDSLEQRAWRQLEVDLQEYIAAACLQDSSQLRDEDDK